MIYVITKKFTESKEDMTFIDDISKAPSFKDSKALAIDLETTGLDPYYNDVVLLAYGDERDQVVIDCTSVKVTNTQLPSTDKIFLGHNIKFDQKFLIAKFDYHIPNVFDTMLTEQKLMQGALKSKDYPEGYTCGLAEVLKRRLDILLDKEERKEFIFSNFQLKVSHFHYVVRDIIHLFPLARKQRELTNKFQLRKYMDNIGNPLSYAVALTELNPFHFDQDRFLENIQKNKKRKFELELELDKEVVNLRNSRYEPTSIEYLRLTGKYSKIRQPSISITPLTLFGEIDEHTYTLQQSTSKLASKKLKNFNKIKEPANPNCVNWGSDMQVLLVLALLKIKCPVLESDVAVEPKIVISKNRLTIDKTFYTFTTQHENLQEMLNKDPQMFGGNLIQLLIQYKSVKHELNAFGVNFLSKINPVTNKIHTLFRTEVASTGRFQSGGGKKESDKINFQNIKRDGGIRECFIPAPNKTLGIFDLSGAEVTIMCDKANDSKLYEWAVKNDDAHSPIATTCWRNVYLYRIGKQHGVFQDASDFMKNKSFGYTLLKELENVSFDENLTKHLDLYENFVISKSQNKYMRTQFKPITFGTVYDMHYKKCALVLGISIDEAAVIVETIRDTIPRTFRYVEACANFAKENYYLILNERTNSRIWFHKLKKQVTSGEKPDWMLLKEVSGKARNCTIQGTQADMIKEAFVMLTRYFLSAPQKGAKILNTVHDEFDIEFFTDQYQIADNMFITDIGRKLLGIDEFITPDNTITANPKYQEAIDSNQILFVDLPTFIANTMTEVANRYLKHFKMKVDYEISDRWKK